MNPTEWIEVDGRGGYASGTAEGLRTRRYHNLLMSAGSPSADRFVLMNGVEAWFEAGAGQWKLSRQAYLGVPPELAPESLSTTFERRPWPRWTFISPEFGSIRHELLVIRNSGERILRWDFSGVSAAGTFLVRPLLSCRPLHALRRYDESFSFDATRTDEGLLWKPYPDVAGITVRTNGAYTHDPDWFHNFFYLDEYLRGYDHVEDLASPGVLTWEVPAHAGEATIVLTTSEVAGSATRPDLASIGQLLGRESSARAVRYRLDSSTDDFMVTRPGGRSLIAGFPWFTEWGRDAFIAMRGLLLSRNRLEDARDVLLCWSQFVSGGLLPNRFPDRGAEPEYNSVDAPLWFIIVADELLEAVESLPGVLTEGQRRSLESAINDIVHGYAEGTGYGIHMDDDGLITAGGEGLALTWMDARIDGKAVTPRHGKPVEVQCLWVNALAAARRFTTDWTDLEARAGESFQARFWNTRENCLYDVVDVNCVPGTVDDTIRPNQVFAAGGLRNQLVPPHRARDIVATVAERLWTPAGLRTLPRGHAAYQGTYSGDVRQRDRAYHQGTVWPWLIGPFIEAWLRVNSEIPDAAQVARDSYLKPFEEHFSIADRGHINEIADGDPPHTGRGCPFQAWSWGEYLRVRNLLGIDDD